MMEALMFLLIVLVVMAVLIWWFTSMRTAHRSTQVVTEREVDNFHQVIIESAQRLVDVINESLKIANESKNADTKVSRLDVAKKRLVDLKSLSNEHPFIELNQVPEVERTIAELEQEFLQSHYRKAAEVNMRGQSLEKEGRIEEATQEYERLLEEEIDTPFTYRRLAIIYSKRKESEEELRVLQAAIKNVPVENSKHYQWFAERLAKKL